MRHFRSFREREREREKVINAKDNDKADNKLKPCVFAFPVFRVLVCLSASSTVFIYFFHNSDRSVFGYKERKG